ncbi:hypothetical protein BCV72DRAFT_319779 [Rhizopus microsporus var. microsporus]|uniref:Uncharacterized protein n=1 Tax=Rhizopus microsporus var. microsporus TaxID=86635 RepID=A0A1X0QQ65_RHIZD|nr:hypothetical protein BCV72DRAFT_319779 [Rhizopus microsporus var. microsporus]
MTLNNNDRSEPLDTSQKKEAKHNSSNAEPSRIITIKTSVCGTGWKAKYIPSLQELVHTVNVIVSHTYAFSKYIYLKELEKNNVLRLQEYVTKDFFREIFLSLVDKEFRDSQALSRSNLSEKVRVLREKTYVYKDDYCDHAAYKPIELKNAQQLAIYESIKIHTDYINNITANFGNRLHTFINRITHKKERIARLTYEMKAKNYSDKVIKNLIKTTPTNFLDDKATEQLQDFFKSYPTDYHFAKDLIYYDAKANSRQHLYAFYTLAKLCEEGNLKTKFDLWGEIVYLNCKVFKNQGAGKAIQFKGTAETDGVKVSVIKQNFETSRSSTSNCGKPANSTDEFRRIENMAQNDLIKTSGNCVLVDPRSRNLLYCMHVNNSPETESTFRYTFNQRAKETKSIQFRKL